MVSMRTLASRGFILSRTATEAVKQPAKAPAPMAATIASGMLMPDSMHLANTTDPSAKTPSTDKSGKPANRNVNTAANATKHRMLDNSKMDRIWCILLFTR